MTSKTQKSSGAVKTGRARASAYAKAELSARHKDEYDALYRFYCEQLGLTTRTRQRPSADGVAIGNGATK
jgi:hypothetical protein